MVGTCRRFGETSSLFFRVEVKDVGVAGEGNVQMYAREVRNRTVRGLGGGCGLWRREGAEKGENFF